MSMLSTVDEELDESTSNGTTYVLIEDSRDYPDLKEALEQLNIHAACSHDGTEYIGRDSVLVVSDFSSAIYKNLRDKILQPSSRNHPDSKCRIMSPRLLINCANKKETIPFSKRPLYCSSMRGLVIVFCGFSSTDKQSIDQLVEWVHAMGGSIRRDVQPSVTHIVAKSSNSSKYRAAVSKDLPIMAPEWVTECWERRDDPDCRASADDMMTLRLPPFHGCTIAFLNFSPDERSQMEQIAVANGGGYCEIGDPLCTHLVIEEQKTKSIPQDVANNSTVVKSEWFWYSVQLMCCADESLYLFQQDASTPAKYRTLRKSVSQNRRRKRESLEFLNHDSDQDSPAAAGLMGRRMAAHGTSYTSANFDATPESIGGSPLQTPVKSGRRRSGKKISKGLKTPEQAPEFAVPKPKITKRHQVASEILQTEQNYVSILRTIINLFKKGVENPNQPGGSILGPQDVKQIFGHIPAVLALHETLLAELTPLLDNWSETASVGDVIVNHAAELQKCYPPFVNYFETTKETIARCKKTVPRFHAFLKVCQVKPECHRQPLDELLARPIQRLPSVELLFSQLVKYTAPDNPDHPKLVQAVSEIKHVNSYINEDKRKTEGHFQIFDIINDIENVPPTLLSARRELVCKVDCIEIQGITNRGESVALFLFNDTLEVCKRRKRGHPGASPAVTASGSGTLTRSASNAQKQYKHLKHMPLQTIRSVVDIDDGDGFKNTFGIVTRAAGEEEMEMMGAYMLVSGDAREKDDFLIELSKRIACVASQSEYESLLSRSSGRELGLEPLDSKSLGATMSKIATKTRKRVSRAFSINSTPNKFRRGLTKSVSQMLSPFKAPHSATPKLGGSRDNQSNDSPMSSLPSTPDLRRRPSNVSTVSFFPGSKLHRNPSDASNMSTQTIL